MGQSERYTDGRGFNGEHAPITKPRASDLLLLDGFGEPSDVRLVVAALSGLLSLRFGRFGQV
jgi:hypothetical protein